MVLPFGLINAVATFQAVMNRVFEHPKFLADGKVNPLAAISDLVLVFIDDILIFSKTAEENVEHVKIVMDVLRQISILINMSACSWGQTEMPYLGTLRAKMASKLILKRLKLSLPGLSLLISMRFSNFLASPTSFASTYRASPI